MTRTLRGRLPLWLLAVLAVPALTAPAALGLVAAPARADRLKASSRIRDIRGRMQVEIRAVDRADVLDSLTAMAAAHGYALVERNPARLRVRLERPATLGEVGALGWKFENTERRRLQFELADVKHRPDRLAVVGAITLVQNPGAGDEREEDMGKVEPYRAELRAVLWHARALFGP